MNFATLSARSLLRNRARVMMTVLAVAIAILTFLLLRTVVYAWTIGVEAAARDRVVSRHKVTFVMTLPKRYADAVRGAPDVKSATFANWFGGKDPAHDREFFGTLAVDTATYFDVMDETVVPKAQLESWKEDRAGAIVGDVLAQKLGWKVGDKVTLESGIYPEAPNEPWTFTVDGIYSATRKSVDRSTFLFHWEFLNDRIPATRRDEIGWIISRVREGRRPADVGVALDRLFDDRDPQTLSQDEQSFNRSFLGSFSAILRAIDIVSGAILIVMMLILGNTIAMGVRERTSEYATLRAIGFRPGHVVLLILVESLLLGIMGGFLGLLIAYPFIEKGMGRWLEENMGAFFPYFQISPRDAILALALSAFLGLAAGIVPARTASGLRVTEALRRVA